VDNRFPVSSTFIFPSGEDRILWPPHRTCRPFVAIADGATALASAIMRYLAGLASLSQGRLLQNRYKALRAIPMYPPEDCLPGWKSVK
jgi:hypothetical protein